jgi:hypothetical protein
MLLVRKKKSTQKRKTSRKNIYLGRRVRDTGKRGLDNIGEVRGITREIIKDYKQHRISYRTAVSRMNLLELVVTRDSDFQGRKEAQAREVIDQARKRLMRMRR